jgi:hypothetical protein
LGCPAFQELIDFLDGRLGLEAAIAVEQHFASGCVKCSGDRAWYGRLRSVGRSDSRFSPPAWARDRAIHLFDEQRENASTDAFNLPEIALLAYDSAINQPMAGARASEASDRQLVYSAGAYSIDIQISTTEVSGAEVIGQILSESERGFSSVAGLLVDLVKPPRDIWSTVTNAVGEFRMIGVDFGDYELMIDTREKKLRVPALPILL